MKIFRILVGIASWSLMSQAALAQTAHQGHWIFTGTNGPEHAAAYWIENGDTRFGMGCRTSDNTHRLEPLLLEDFVNVQIGSRGFPIFDSNSRNAPEIMTNAMGRDLEAPMSFNGLEAGKLADFIPPFTQLMHACSRGVAIGPVPSTRACRRDMRSICQDPELSQLDRDVAEAYIHLTRNIPLSEVKGWWDEQKIYLEAIKDCAASRKGDCFKPLMSERLAALGGQAPKDLPAPTPAISALVSDERGFKAVLVRHGLAGARVVGMSGDTVYVFAELNGQPRRFALRDQPANVRLSAKRQQDLVAWAEFFEDAPEAEWLEHVNLNVVFPPNVQVVTYMPNSQPALTAARIIYMGPAANNEPAGGYFVFDYVYPALSGDEAIELMEQNELYAVMAVEYRQKLEAENTARRDLAIQQARDIAEQHESQQVSARENAPLELLASADIDIKRPSRGVVQSYVSERALLRSAFEADIARQDAEEGMIYRGDWFWAYFEAPDVMRTIFRGNRIMQSTERPVGRTYRLTPLELGTVWQNAAVLGWARAFEDRCAAYLPTDAPVFENTNIETVSRTMFTRYGMVPMGESTSTTTTRIRMSPELYPGFIASREASERAQSTANLKLVIDFFQGGPQAALDQSVSRLRPYIVALRDMVVFLDLAGCDSPTTRQMAEGLVWTSRGQSAPPGEFTSRAAAVVSDPPQAAGEIFSIYEACLGDGDWENAKLCPCVVDKAFGMPAFAQAMITMDVDAVWTAFMQDQFGESAAQFRQCNVQLGFR